MGMGTTRAMGNVVALVVVAFIVVLVVVAYIDSGLGPWLGLHPHLRFGCLLPHL